MILKDIIKEFDEKFVYRKENQIDIMTKEDEDGDRVEVNGEFGKIKNHFLNSHIQLLQHLIGLAEGEMRNNMRTQDEPVEAVGYRDAIQTNIDTLKKLKAEYEGLLNNI